MDKVFLNRILVGLFCKIADVMSHFGREQFLGNGRILRVVLLFVGFGFVSTNIFAQPLQASFSASKIFNVSCFGGKDGAAEVSVVGGLPPYSYFWDIQAKFQTTRRAVNLTAGTYEVWVTDATSTSVKAQVLVSQSPRLSVNVDGSSIVNVLCQGNFSGSAIAVADGGTPPYNYVWSDGQFGATASKLKAGYYSVYVTDALGCSTSPSLLQITEPNVEMSAIILNSMKANATCYGANNGGARVLALNGKSPYKYEWSHDPSIRIDTVGGLSPGGVSVKVTDANGCWATASTFISEPENMIAFFETKNVINPRCAGYATGQAKVTVAGGSGIYEYLWNTLPAQGTNTAIKLSKGVYTVEVKDSKKCAASATVTISTPTALSSEVRQTDVINVSCRGSASGEAKVLVQGGVLPYTYNWSAIGQENADRATNLLAGSYIVWVQDANECQTSSSFYVSQPEGELSIATVYNQVFDVSCNGYTDGSAHIEVVDGTPPYKSVRVNSVPSQGASYTDLTPKAEYYAQNLGAGYYIASVEDANGCKAQAGFYIFEPKPLTSKFTADNVNMVSCYGTSTGLAQVLASGGNSPYTYRWSHSTAEVSAIATSLFAGSYTVTVVDSKKCEVNASVTITQPSAPLQAEIKPEDVINLKCKADGTGQATVNVWGGTPPYNIDWGDPLYQRGNVLRNVYAGFYAATITDANHCPELTRGVTITEPSSVMVSVDLTSVVQNPCWGDKKGEAKVIATGGTPPYRYLWNDSKSQKTALAVGLPKGYFEALAFDTNNCYAATAVEIRQPINPLNVYFKSYDVKHIQCFGDTDGEASFTLTGGTPPYKYLWNTIPAQTGETAKYLTSGTYTVTITDNNLCQISSPVEIQSPSAALKSKVLPENVSHNLCYGKSTGAVKLTVSGGTTPYSYLWDDPYERIASQIDQLQAGTYHVKITDWNDCVTLDSVTITQPPLIVVTAQKTDILSCYNENIGSIKLSAVGGVPPYQFSINNGLSYPSTDGIFNYLPPSSAYFPRVKDANNCTIRGDFVVINAPPPIQFKDIRFTDVTCMGFNDGTITLLADGGTGALRYSIDGGLNFLANGGAFLYLKPGTYQLAANDANKCFYNGGELTIKEPLELYLTEQLAIDGCHNANNGIVYTQASGGVGPYSYSLDGVNYQESGRFYDRKPGTYEVLVTDRMGCQTKSYPLKISNPASVAGFTTSIIEGCSPLKVQFKNNVQNMLGYLWSFGDGAGSAEYSPLHTYINRTNNSQIDTVYSYVKSPQGCIDTASTKILVHGMPFVDISAAPKNQTFPNATVSVEDFSDPGFAKYKLIYADGLTNETNQQVGSYTHNYTTWGKYDIHLIVSNDHCWNADTAIVNILPPAAKPSFSPSIGGGCVPYTFVFENSSLYSKSYYWDFGDNTHSTALSPAHTYTQAGVYEVRLQALGMDDLPRTATHTVTVFPLPKPNFVALPDTVYLPRQFVNFENLSHGGVHYTWDFGDGNLSEASDPFHQYRIPGSFTVKLTATSDYGCVDSISKLALITVLSRPLMLFPNAFTPSAFGPTDGSYDPLVSTNNSVFYPLNNAVSHYELRIFNAWGAEIFRTTNVKQGWDGYISGKLAPMGVYVWKAKGTFVNGQLFEDAGDVTLIR